MFKKVFKKQLIKQSFNNVKRLYSTDVFDQIYIPKGSRPHLGIVMVPQAELWVIERFGKYSKTLESGLNFLLPIVDTISYRHTVKEVAFPIKSQTAITKDNVQLSIDGVVYIKVIDAYKASYAIENPYFAISNLAQTTMRAEIGKITLDKTFSERQSLNLNIVSAIEKVASNWGISIERYEIKDMNVPVQIKNAMELEAEAERKKRKTILDSEGQSEYEKNVAEGRKNATVLSSEAQRMELENIAKGEAFSIKERAKATAESIKIISDAINQPGGEKAVSFQVAKDYITAFEKLAQQGNTIIVPANVNDVSSMITQAMSVYKGITEKKGSSTPQISKEEALEKLAQELKEDKGLVSKLQ